MQSSRFLPRYGALVLALNLCACGYILPDNPSTERYNGVMGERHAPQLNPQGQQGASSASAASPSPDQVAQADMPNLPPVDDATKARAAEEIASAPLPAPQTPATPTPPATATAAPVTAVAQTAGNFDLPPATISTAAANAPRQVPVENAATGIQVSQNSYPDLSSVPPRPKITGDGSTAAHLSTVRSGLEQDRDNATAAKAQLSKDAASEPEMQPAPLPETTGTVPPPTPVSVTPVTPPPPQSSITPMTTPVTTRIISADAAPIAPPSPVFAPPPPPMNMGGAPVDAQPFQSASLAPAPATPAFAPAPSAPAPSASYSQPSVTYYSPQSPVMNPPSSALPPIVLHPPGDDTAPVAPPSYSAAPSWSAPQQTASADSGFNPMATGRAPAVSNQQSPYAATDSYLPDSRYGH